ARFLIPMAVSLGFGVILMPAARLHRGARDVPHHGGSEAPLRGGARDLRAPGRRRRRARSGRGGWRRRRPRRVARAVARLRRGRGRDGRALAWAFVRSTGGAPRAPARWPTSARGAAR